MEKLRFALTVWFGWLTGDLQQLIEAIAVQELEEVGSILHALWGLAYRSAEGSAVILQNGLVEAAAGRLGTLDEPALAAHRSALWLPTMGLLSALSKYEEQLAGLMEHGVLELLEQGAALPHSRSHADTDTGSLTLAVTLALTLTLAL